MKKKQDSMQWVHVPAVSRSEPSETITQDKVIAFRNGLFKLSAHEPYKGSMAGIIVIRCAIDLDHLAQIMEPDANVFKYNVVVATEKTHKAKT